jgi:hypothetical protein
VENLRQRGRCFEHGYKSDDELIKAQLGSSNGGPTIRVTSEGLQLLRPLRAGDSFATALLIHYSTVSPLASMDSRLFEGATCFNLTHHWILIGLGAIAALISLTICVAMAFGFDLHRPASRTSARHSHPGM